jgi:D-alanyl-D-alanine carboxypeptidase (penicillin-binding protein 5/6)
VSPTLPRVTETLDPALSVGGPRLAAMNSVIVDLPAGVPAPPDVRDVAWLIADADTGEVLAAKNPHAHLLPASTLKTLTAIHLLPRIAPETVLTATSTAANAEGTRVGMVAGATYTARQLFQALIMSSANDAAYGLANLNGGLDKTVAELNTLAGELGAHDTVVADPSGLDAPGQHSSAYDLALFGRAAIAMPAYVTLATTKTATFPAEAARASRTRSTYAIGNHNRLLWNYPGTIGVKNGFTKAAHRTFIGAATRGGRTYIVTEMHGTESSSWRPAASLLDWAFAHGDVARPVGRLVERGEVTAAPAATAAVTPTQAPAPSPVASAEAFDSSPSPESSDAPPVAAALTTATDVVPPWLLPSAGGALLLLGLVTWLARRGRHRH